MATDAGTTSKAVTARIQLFTPESLRVIPEIRTLLRRVLKVERDTLEYTGEEFAGYIAFTLPNADIYAIDDVLTVCAELAQESIGRKADVDCWFVRTLREGVVGFQPRDYDLQEEDEAPRRNPYFNQHAADVRPSEGW